MKFSLKLISFAPTVWSNKIFPLILRWRFVIHGGIDGCTRKIVFLQCHTNNRATTVLESFLSGVREHGLPSRVRTDKGTENVDVARYMIHHPTRGPGRGSIITGRSVHNQRIERFWRDLFCGCLHAFYNLFYELETSGVLNPHDDIHWFCLHYVFLPRLSNSLTRFMDGWNAHPLSTENNMIPNQLWIRGLMSISNNSGSVAQGIWQPTTEVCYV